MRLIVNDERFRAGATTRFGLVVGQYTVRVAGRLCSEVVLFAWTGRHLSFRRAMVLGEVVQLRRLVIHCGKHHGSEIGLRRPGQA
jgi:hypothetical protein